MSPLHDTKMSTILAENITIHTPSWLKTGFQALGVPAGGGISHVSGYLDSSAGAKPLRLVAAGFLSPVHRITGVNKKIPGIQLPT